MKKIALAMLIIFVASVLIAALPAGENGSRCYDPIRGKWFPCKIKFPGQGEPGMEKVTSFRYTYSKGSIGGMNRFCNNVATWHAGKATWYYCVKTYELPVGCNFRYQY